LASSDLISPIESHFAKMKRSLLQPSSSRWVSVNTLGLPPFVTLGTLSLGGAVATANRRNVPLTVIYFDPSGQARDMPLGSDRQALMCHSLAGRQEPPIQTLISYF
jgi:hypothetical protein